MTAERRLAKLEGALSPKAATLLWLAEAQQFGSLPAYVAWLIDQPISATPLERVSNQARAGTLAAMRGQTREAVRDAAHRAVRDAVFLVELVLRLNSVVEETIRIEGLRYAVLFWEMRALTVEAELSRRRESTRVSTLAERWHAWREGSAALVGRLYAAEEARLLLERRYLEGHAALFPDAVEEWEQLRDSTERLASLGDALRPLMEGRRRAPRSAGVGAPCLDLVALRSGARSRTPALASRLVDEARAATLDVLGDTEGATSIAARRLRATVSDEVGVAASKGRRKPDSGRVTGRPGSSTPRGLLRATPARRASARPQRG
jgi:hypothetical protein